MPVLPLILRRSASARSWHVYGFGKLAPKDQAMSKRTHTQKQNLEKVRERPIDARSEDTKKDGANY
jgi:hypothetical protein